MAQQQRPREQESPRQPRLLVPRREAADKIAARISLGKELLSASITSFDELRSARESYARWTAHTRDLLGTLFDQQAVADQYAAPSGVGGVARGESDPDLKDQRSDYLDEVRTRVSRLEALLGRLELFPEPDGGSSSSTASSAVTRGVFIVHGQDREARESMARFVQQLGLEPILLEEQPDQGLTVIDRFEQHAARAGYALVLLTADDVGGPTAHPEQAKPRARQTVVFELGFLAARLGRGRVAALMRGAVEIPSAYGGVLYAPLDEHGGWRLPVAKDIQAAGLPVAVEGLLG